MKLKHLLTLTATILCITACSSSQEASETESDTAAETLTTEEVPTETADEEKTTVEEITTEEENTEAVTTEAPKERDKGIIITGSEKVAMSGDEEDKYLITEYSYIESDKYFLFLDKDISLPGDFKIILDEIVDELEKNLGLIYNPSSHEYSDYDIMEVYFGSDPWKDIRVGRKIPIYLVVDREDEGWTSFAMAECLVISDYELISDEVWNSVTGYKDNPWRREGKVNYMVYAHELTHTITTRYVDFNGIMQEGVAEYMTKVIMGILMERYADETKFSYYTYDTEFDPDIKPDTAESIFEYDFRDLDSLHRGAEYTCGKFLCTFLNEKVGECFLLPYVNEVKKAKLEGTYGFYTDDDYKLLTELFKKVYGDTIFEEFGEWFQAHREELYG